MDSAFPSQGKPPGSDGQPAGFTAPASPGPGYGSQGGGRGRGRGFRGTAENAKTKLCTRWLQGDCRFGDRCNFAHGEHELRTLPPRPDGGRGGRGRGAFAGYAPGPGRGTYPGPGRGFAPGRGGYAGYGGYGQGGYGGGGYGEQGPQGFAGAGMEQRAMNEDVWAAQGYPTPGPNGWYMYRTKETGESYYHNHRTNVTQWDKPADWN